MTVMHYDRVEATFSKANLTLEELREFVANTQAFDGKTVIQGEWSEPKFGKKPNRIHVQRAIFGASTPGTPDDQ